MSTQRVRTFGFLRVELTPTDYPGSSGAHSLLHQSPSGFNKINKAYYHYNQPLSTKEPRGEGVEIAAALDVHVGPLANSLQSPSPLPDTVEVR